MQDNVNHPELLGCLEDEAQARALPAVQAVYEAFRADPGAGRMAPGCYQMLSAACDAAGVSVGAYDDRILAWLAGFGPETCAVVAGLITRAAALERDPDLEQWLGRQLARARTQAAGPDDLAAISQLAALPGHTAETVARWLRQAREGR